MTAPDASRIEVVAILDAAPDHAQTVAGILAALVAPSQAEPGCLLYELRKDRADPHRFVFIETWENQAALDAHEQTAHFLNLATALAGRLVRPPQVIKLMRLEKAL